MTYHFIPARMAIIKKSTNNKCWRGCGEISYDIPYMWNLKRNDTNELTYKTDSRDFENELMVANGKRDS